VNRHQFSKWLSVGRVGRVGHMLSPASTVTGMKKIENQDNNSYPDDQIMTGLALIWWTNIV
jgi:hypothetical protein